MVPHPPSRVSSDGVGVEGAAGRPLCSRTAHVQKVLGGRAHPRSPPVDL
jgi:hypothetical protein